MSLLTSATAVNGMKLRQFHNNKAGMQLRFLHNLCLRFGNKNRLINGPLSENTTFIEIDWKPWNYCLKKALNYLDNKDVQDNLRTIFRDILTGTSLITLITASAIWIVKEYDVAGSILILPHAFFGTVIFMWCCFCIQSTSEQLFSLKKKRNRLCVAIFILSFQVATIYSILNIIIK